jgi:hypothetical protein
MIDTGDDSNLFTSQTEHNGFFYGLRGARAELHIYIALLTNFDFFHTAPFSMFAIQDMLNLLDHIILMSLSKYAF